MIDPLPSLDLILSFRAVMQTGSLSGAARLLSLAHPTVRRHIEQLEQAVDATLFTRATNGLTPTELAHRLRPMAEALAAQGAAFQRAASAEVDHIGGTVRLTCSHVLATYVLPHLLPQLLARHPDLRIELVASNDSQDVLRRAVDIAIRMTKPQQLALVSKALAPIPIGLYASPAWIARHGEATRDVQDLAALPLISDDSTRAIEDGIVALGHPRPQNVVLRCDDQSAQIAAIAAGVGVGLCQAGIAARLGLLSLMPDVQTTLPCYVVMHEDQRKIARLRVVFDYLCDTLPTQLAVP